MAVLISIATWLGSKLADKLFDKGFEKLTMSDPQKKHFRNCVEQAAIKLEARYPDGITGDVETLFKQDDVFSELLKILYRKSDASVEKISQTIDTSTLPPGFVEEFLKLLKEELLQDQEFDKILAEKDTYTRIGDISWKLDLIAGTNLTYQDFENLYRKNAPNNVSQLNFMGLSVGFDKKKSRKNLMDVFVEPRLLLTKKDLKTISETLQDEVRYPKLLGQGDRLVILGDPGSGKSMLLKVIMYELLKKGKTFSPDCYEYLPIRIELRKYLDFKKKGGVNILDYMACMLLEEYAIQGITANGLRPMLEKSKFIFLFDGLDEIFDLEKKIGVKNDIEFLHNSYPGIRSITTSRKIGYEEASLNKEQFKELSICLFNEDQVNEYVEKWYAHEEIDDVVRTGELESFYVEKQNISQDLVENPLLLSLIVILYRNGLRIPKSRLEFYQSCTQTLVSRWDNDRNLVPDMEENILRSKDKLLSELAYWQYQQLTLNTGKISAREAKRVVSRSIQEKCQVPEDQSDDMADKFMMYAEKRSIYFDNNFTHKTFLEYYTAYWIFSNVEKKHDTKKRDEIISEFIKNPFWFIVLELYFNMIDSDQPDTEIMDSLYREQLRKSDLSIPCLLSILPSLKNISDAVSSELVSRSIDVLLAFEKDRKDDYDNLAPDHAEFTIFAGLRNLFDSAINPKFRNLILDEMKKRELLPGTNLPGLYALYLELLDFRNAIPRKDFEVGQSELYDNSIKEHPYLYFMDFYHQWPWVEGAPIEKHTFYISHFGDSQLYQEMQTRYSKQLYTGFIHVIISSLCLDRDRSSRIRAMVGSGLDVTKFLTYLTDLNRTDLANVVSDEATLVDFLGSEQEIVYLQAVLLSLIKVFRYNKGSMDSIIEQIKDPQKREQVRDLAVTNRQNKIKWVMDGAAQARQQQAVQK